jgi:hypothetical protein
MTQRRFLESLLETPKMLYEPPSSKVRRWETEGLVTVEEYPRDGESAYLVKITETGIARCHSFRE